jgi:serine phosphatase RsbU (regulator of sigma subunit)
VNEDAPSGTMPVDTHQTKVFQAGAYAAVAPAERQHFLVGVQGSHVGERIPLSGQALRFGRGASCAFVVRDDEVSGQHCEISAHAAYGEALVTDLRSTNGSFIDGIRVQGSAQLPAGGVLQIGRQVFRHDWLLKSDVDQSQELERDLDKARRYVQSLLPPPIADGPVRTDWIYQPSSKLGGDAFGYHQLGEGVFACYLVDVSGHGVGAAMHGVTVMNVLRQRALPGVDFHEPSQVLRSLNAMFQMEAHDGMYFSAWYGVYDAASRVLKYASAGHHPAFLAASGQSSPRPLQTRNLVIGAAPGVPFVDAQTVVEPASRLYIFSDGVFEVVTADGGQWALPDFLPLLDQRKASPDGEAARLYRAVREVARPGPLDDDFSMLVVTLL